jgi:DNA-binding CsgD family transcriptional regulator/PAS domain-containing protein
MARTKATRDALLTLIDLAYAAVETDCGWEPFLLRLGDALAATTPALVLHDMKANGGIAINVRADPEATRLYNEHWYKFDPWALSPAAPRVAVVGRAILDAMLVPYAEVQKSDYHRAFAHRFGISRLITAPLAPGTFLVATRAHEHAPFGTEELRFLQALTPHVQRANRLRSLVARLQDDVNAAHIGLDAVPIGILFTDAEGRVLHANAAAERLLDARDGIALDRTQLKAATVKATQELRALCAGVTSSSEAASGRPLLLPRASGRASLQVLVCPNRLPQDFTVARDRASALVLIVDPAEQVPPPRELLRVYFGLTPAESDIAARLALGETLEVIADALGYTRETMRWYSKQLMSKCQARSRTELVRRLSSPLLSVAPGSRS